MSFIPIDTPESALFNGESPRSLSHSFLEIFVPEYSSSTSGFDSSTNIRIDFSTFDFENYSQDLLQSNKANNLSLGSNYIATKSSVPLISQCNSRNICANNNCVVNHQYRIDQYYTSDATNPCQMNSIDHFHLFEYRL